MTRALFFASMIGLVLILAGCGGGSSTTTTSTAPKPAPVVEKPKAPLVPKTEIADWCPEHGLPESVCSMCSEKVAEDFKKKGDWCKEHNRAESQCFLCHPELKEKFAAMKPKNAQ